MSINRALASFVLCVFMTALTSLAHAQEMSFLSAAEGNPFMMTVEYLRTAGTSGDNGAGSALEDSRFGVAIPLHTGPENNFSLGLRGQRLQFSDRLRLNDRQIDLPQDFGSGEIGLAWSNRSEERTIGITGGVGSTGRRLFDNENTKYLNANGFLQRKLPNGNAWVYFLNYSSNRTFLNHVPLPGVAYAINDKSYNLILGVPMVFLLWRPMPFMVNLALLPFFVTSEASMFVGGPFQVFTSFGWTPRAYENIISRSQSERLMFDRKDASVGVRAMFNRQTNVSLAYTYGFNRRLFVGESVTKPESDKVELNNAGGLMLRLRAGF